MITNYRYFSRKKTFVAFALLISICFISLTLSCLSGVSEVKGVDTGRAYNLQEIDTRPKAVHMVQPIYPFEAKAQEIEGKVVVNLVVTKEGTARDVSVFESSPEGVFDQAAIEAAKQWIFDPGKIGGEPVETRIRVPFVFKTAPPAPDPSN